MQRINLRSYDEASRFITQECLRACAEENKIRVSDLVFRLLRSPRLPMHCPQHHYLIPAAMLTAARKVQAGSLEELRDDLTEAMMRAKNVLPAFCGLYGSCGTAVGLGIYTSILLNADQYSIHSWALVNRIAGECLLKIAEIDGPRCCKRNSYIALQVGELFSKEVLGLDLGTSEHIQCSFYEKNASECKKQACPFYPLNGID